MRRSSTSIRSNNHRRNWIECIRGGKQTICPAEVGQRSAAVCHLANIGYRLRRALTWDPVKERFVDDAEANKLTTNEPRGCGRFERGESAGRAGRSHDAS